MKTTTTKNTKQTKEELEESLTRAHRALAYGIAHSAEQLCDMRTGLYPASQRLIQARAHKRLKQHIAIWLIAEERKAVRAMAAQRLKETRAFNRKYRREQAALALAA